ncbi:MULTISPECIES: hypothetical protein [Saccharothrix]|uniref:hypothetical protein n=1 Tax=Saccharothrix TaxID=2071 RepID=UPI0011614122|nr:hypothetical protein [Saccharothrix sp. CB00851]
MKVPGRVIAAALGIALSLLMACGTAHPAWMSVFGEQVECTVLGSHMERTSKYGKEWHYSLQCGDRRHDSVVLTSNETYVGDPGDRTVVVFDRHELVAPLRPENMTSVGLWLLPLLLVGALGIIAWAATGPVRIDPPRRPRGKPEPEPVDQEFL